ncbi:MAG: hypothetical protein GEU92_00585 [Alphaproteobacteria bacterium]|nr:hypothetical protein [Alphaproteobacteria bacterium]
MPPRTNPLRLNPLQLRTLAILQQLARYPETSTKNEETGEVMITNLPNPHGNHFHCGDAVVASKDATGLRNEAVYTALERKGLARSFYPLGIALTLDGVVYDTGVSDRILHRADH